jgi:hypothetical protein
MPVVPEIIQAFWLGAVGALYLGNWPGGRGPAWETGHADPWPTAAERRGLVPAGDADGGGAGDSGTASGNGAAAEPPEPVPQRPSSRKRRRKR